MKLLFETTSTPPNEIFFSPSLEGLSEAKNWDEFVSILAVRCRQRASLLLNWSAEFSCRSPVDNPYSILMKSVHDIVVGWAVGELKDNAELSKVLRGLP